MLGQQQQQNGEPMEQMLVKVSTRMSFLYTERPK